MPTVTKAANAHTIVTTGWTNPSNAFATTTDSSFATGTPGKNGTVSGDFGFANFTSADIPDGSTIISVTINFNIGMSAAVTGGIVGGQIYRSGVAQGTETTTTSTTQATQTQQVTTGISLADLRSASTVLKARIRVAQGNTTSAMTGNLDFVSVTVSYNPPPPKPPIIQVVDLAKRIAHAFRHGQGAVLVQGQMVSQAPDTATVQATLPLLQFAAAGNVDVAGTLTFTVPSVTFASGGAGVVVGYESPAIIIHKPLPRSRFGGFMQLMGMIPAPIVTNGTVGFTLPLMTMQSAGQVPGAWRIPAIMQVKKVPLAPLSGGMVQLAQISAGQPIINTNGSISLNLPLISFQSAGLAAGNDVKFSIPKMTFAATGQPNELINQSLVFVQKAPLPRFAGSVKLLKPARQPLALGTGAINTTLPLLQFTASGSVPISGTIALSLPKLTFAASSVVALTATANIQLPLLQFTAAGSVNITGSVALTIPLLQFNLSEGATALSQVVLSLPRLLWQTSGEVRDLDGSLLGSGPTSGQLFPR